MAFSTCEYTSRVQRTDDELLLVEALQLHSMRLRNYEHALDAFTCPLFAEHHLENGGVNGFACYLTAEQVELSMGNLEVCCGVLVLQ